jgi:arsenite transporter
MDNNEPSPLGIFGRYLSLWVGLCILLGVILGKVIPGVFLAIGHFEIAQVNLTVAVLIWIMIYPMMVQVDFSSIRNVGRKPKGILMTLAVNWLIKPFSMAALGWLFFEHLFAGIVQPEDAKQYIAGMILLGVAPCTAMVFVWSQLVRGDANYTLVQVSVNDLIMVVLFAPLAGFLLGVTEISVPWNTLLFSVVLYVVVPLGAGILTRRILLSRASGLEIFDRKTKPLGIIGLLSTLVILFALQAQTIIDKPLSIALIAVPLIIQSYGIFAVTYGWGYFWRLPHPIAAPAALIGTSNFFELAVAVAISLYGIDSGAALATVVGVLVEVPVMLSLVALANRTKHLFPS